MKRCKNLACVKWDTLDSIKHAINSDIQVVTGIEATVKQTWLKTGSKEDIDPILRVLDKMRWRLQDRIEQINDIVNDNNKE